YITQGKASATGMHASVPGAPAFFSGADDSVSLALADITQPANPTVSALGVDARVKPFLFDPANPAALRGKVVNSLSTLVDELKHLSTRATAAAPQLGPSIQLIGQPFGSFARVPELEAALADMTATPPDNLQALVAVLRQRLGGEPKVSVSFDGTNLVLSVDDTHDLAPDPQAALGWKFQQGGSDRGVVGTGPSGR